MTFILQEDNLRDQRLYWGGPSQRTVNDHIKELKSMTILTLRNDIEIRPKNRYVAFLMWFL